MLLMLELQIQLTLKGGRHDAITPIIEPVGKAFVLVRKTDFHY